MIHIRKSADGKFYFTVTAQNNEVVATSETYESKQAAQKGIEALTVEIVRGLTDEQRIKDHTK